MAEPLCNRLAPLIAEAGSGPHALELERELFEAAAPEKIAAVLDRFCGRVLGAAVDRYEFFATGVGSVHGLRLTDGRRVVVKFHRQDVDPAHLAAAQRVQRHLRAHGFPCPRPLLGPTAVGNGLAVVDALLEAGARGDAHDPRIRAAMARALASMVDVCRPLVGVPGLRPGLLAAPPPDRLWPVPHDHRFDFQGTSSGAEWIDRLAGEARRQRDTEGAGDLVIGHSDWRVEHLRFSDGDVSAVYDCDSLSVERETVLVGSAAHAFTADWSVEGWRCVPTIDECRALVADYESPRETPFSVAERRTVDAALVYALAYSARCEHSDAMASSGTQRPRLAKRELAADSFGALLGRHGAELLRIPPVDFGPTGS